METKEQDNPYSPISVWGASQYQTTRTDTAWDEFQGLPTTPLVCELFKMDIDMQPFDGHMSDKSEE